MPLEVEISLRVPNTKVRLLDENGYPIDNGSVRFKKLIELPSLPKPGSSLELTTASGKSFDCDVVRADWHEERGLFVLACQYSKRSIPADEYNALVHDSDWQMKPLI
jgi:hypothetical protein